MKRVIMLLILAALSLSALLAAAPAGAVARTRCFSETGQCVAGPILDYWERNGGLQVFGYPITGQYVDVIEGWTGLIQWFERDRLEDHGRHGVLAGRLVFRPSYSDTFKETEDGGPKTAPAFVLRLPSSVQAVKLARTNY